MVYNIILFLIYIIIRITMLFNEKIRIFFTKRIIDVKPIEKGEYIYIHASSVGEVNLLDSLIKKILENKENKIILSVVTDTGYEQARIKYNSPRIKIIFFPLDFKFAIDRIFKEVTLKKSIIVETEIWPNTIDYLSKNSSLYLVNGRISQKSFKNYSKIKFLLNKVLNKFDALIMQSEDDKNRIIDLGASKDKVYNFGNLKFSLNFEKYEEKELVEFKNSLFLNKKVIVAGSTREGEEEILINIFKRLKNYQLILVPRHLDRLEEVKGLLSQENYSLYSEIDKESDIILVDKMGVLRKFYAISDISFVGGTLVDVGGHSLLEPLYYGKKPIFGKYLQNVKDISNEILKLEFGYKVENMEEFIDAVNKIENSEDTSVAIKKFIKENGESLKDTYELIFK